MSNKKINHTKYNNKFKWRKSIKKPTTRQIVDAILDEIESKCVLREKKWVILPIKCGTCLLNKNCKSQYLGGRYGCEKWC